MAIRNPVDVRSDQTLYAILLLCGYEVSVPRYSAAFRTKNMLTMKFKTIMFDSKTLLAWGAHVDGVATLLKIRGHEALGSPVSRAIFFFVRKNVVRSASKTHTLSC